MSVEVKSEYIDIGGSNVLLVSVKNGSAVIGTCSAGYIQRSGDSTAQTRLFYIGNDPVVSLTCPNHGSKRTDKLISFAPGFQGVDHSIRDALTESFNKINHGDSLEIGLREIFSLLSDGVYTVYTSEYYPTDGAGNLFWGAYNITHEVRGTAEQNRVIGKEKVYRPCFLVPSQPLDEFLPKIKASTDEQTKTRRIQGIVYHLSGMHSVLLKGHHGAVSCIERDLSYKCAVIERITDTYTEAPVIPEAPPEEENAEQPAPAPEAKPEGVTGFRSASVKIPLEKFPKDMLRLLIETRGETKPSHYNTLVNKYNTVRRKSVSNQVLPRHILERCDQMPDIEMMESVFTITDLSDEQLNCLLAGDTEMNGQLIISANFYSSIVTACNYLQFHSESRFVEFSLAIMDNPELSATHEYIARRVSRLEDNRTVYRYFKTAVESDEPRYEKIRPIAERFVSDYEKKNA